MDKDETSEEIIKTIDAKKISCSNYTYFETNSEVPYTGKIVEYYENGQKKSVISVKDGKEHGLKTAWHENGQKRLEQNWKDGKWHGLWGLWFENGEIVLERYYENGKEVSKPY